MFPYNSYKIFIIKTYKNTKIKSYPMSVKKKQKEVKQKRVEGDYSFFVWLMLFLLVSVSLFSIIKYATDEKSTTIFDLIQIQIGSSKSKNIAVGETKLEITKSKTLTQITGFSTTQTGTVGFTILSACNIILYEGWNFISICSNITNTSVENVFSDVDNDYRYIMEWNESSQDFLLYSPRASDNPFEDVKRNQSYFVYYVPTNTSTLNFISLDDYESMNFTIPEGWNALFYPYLFTTNFSIYLDTMGDTYRYFMLWNKDTQDFELFSPRESEHEIQYINRGEGQFIYCDATTCTLRYVKEDLD